MANHIGDIKTQLVILTKNIKTEVFPRSIGRKIAEAEEIRHASDYDDFYIATVDEAQEQIETAKELIQLIEVYLETLFSQTKRKECDLTDLIEYIPPTK